MLSVVIRSTLTQTTHLLSKLSFCSKHETLRSTPAALIICFSCVLASLATAGGSGPETILQSLYRAHEASKGPFSQTKDRGLVERYFTGETAALIWKDAVAADGEVGALDFDPLYASQDPQVTNFKIGEVQWGGIVKHAGDQPEDGLAVVEVTYKDSGKPRSIGFRFQQNSQKAWKISDINYSDGRTLVGILRGDGAGPNGGNASKPTSD